MKRFAGFTLVELLVVISIISILAGIAYPSYQSYILDSRRGEAKAELIKAQLKQTALHILSPLYTKDKIALGLTDSVHYNFSVISAGKTTYLMQAIAIGGQTRDAECLTLTINQNNDQTPINCW